MPLIQRQGEKQQRWDLEYLPLKQGQHRRSLGRIGRWESQKFVLPHAELLGGQLHAVYCALCLLFHGGMGAVGGGVGRRTAPGLPRWAVKEMVHPPSLVSRWRSEVPADSDYLSLSRYLSFLIFT